MLQLIRSGRAGYEGGTLCVEGGHAGLLRQAKIERGDAVYVAPAEDPPALFS